jgi:hypothetical protein
MLARFSSTQVLSLAAPSLPISADATGAVGRSAVVESKQIRPSFASTPLIVTFP